MKPERDLRQELFLHWPQVSPEQRQGFSMTAAAHTAYHLRPAEGGWINDPNGVTKVGDTWHVFFQHNPAGPWHGNIAWGHASSHDLAAWQQHPIAFSPTPGGPDEFGCWSGCYVPGGDHPTMAYSGIQDASLRSTVCLRYGSDDLVTWSDPLVVAETPGADDIAVMRDPFVFDFDGRRWAILGARLGNNSPAVILFNRDDETAWTYEGLFATDHHPVYADADAADIWECPQLVKVDDRWVLILSLQHSGVLGEVVAVIGDVDTRDGRPRFTPERLKVLDEGSDFYAPQVVQTDGRPLMFGWIRQEDQDPSYTNHAGCLSLPRRLYLLDGEVGVTVDEVAEGALAGPALTLAPGRTCLDGRQARLRMDTVGSQLIHDDLDAIALPSGAEIWIDGPVLELYVRGGVPSTWRSTKPWAIEVPEDTQGTISEVGPWIP